MLQCVDAASGLGPVLIGHDGVRTACGIAAGGHPVDHRLGQATRSQCRSEEHTSELQSPCNLVCRLLLEKKKHTHVSSNAAGKSNPALNRHAAQTTPRAISIRSQAAALLGSWLTRPLFVFGPDAPPVAAA